MSRLVDLFRLIPGSARVISMVILIGGATYFVYRQFGLMPALFLLGGIAVIFILILLYNLVLKASERQNGLAFGKAISNAQVGASAAEVKSAVGAIAQKWREAGTNLKDAGLDLYTLPWYMLIGEPQSGKSTTLKFSGMKFPVGMESISGGGGTRNCDWWFTEHAVILDTAGRLTFQEENATDAAEWQHFLNLLAKHRPYCPINGVLLVIPATSLLGDDAATRQLKARNISEKLLNIQRTLAIQFPVFVLVTKADTIYGFTEFFNKLNVDQQREMFGWSSPTLESGFNLNTFDQSFGQLIGRVDQIRRRNLSRTHYSDDANKTFIFPEEFTALYQPLREYMSIIFEDSVYRAPMFFRGYYFTSGLQQGQPIANACRALLQKGTVIANLEQIFQKSRAFFIRDFYTEKVFPEQGLVQRAFHHLRSDKIKRRVIYGLNISFVVLGAIFMFWMYRSLNARLAGPKKAIDETLTLFRDSEGTFFTGDHEREDVYKNLKNLQSAIGAGQIGGFFQGRQNSLTAHLQDTFSYVFLDRFLVGLYDSVHDQLKAFELAAPDTPRSSDRELDLLLSALAEVNNWRFHSANGSLDDLEPSLKPFLDLTIDPEWNNDLAQHLGSEDLKDQLDKWFLEVHGRSSRDVKRFVIQALVDRTNDLFTDLHKSVLTFYANQPEMKRYLEKVQVLEELDQAYHDAKGTYLSPSSYNDTLMTFATFFSPENQDMLAPGGDIYLTVPEIVERTCQRLGGAFDTLTLADDKPSSKEKSRRELQNDTVTFVRLIRAIEPKQYRDPRSVREGENPNPEGLTYPAEIRSFWDHVVEGYSTTLTGDGYQELPLSSESNTGNFKTLFSRGFQRMAVINEMAANGLDSHVASMGDDRDAKRLEDNLDQFCDYLETKDRRDFSDALVRCLGRDVLEVPPPGSSSWRSFVRDLESRTERGRKYELFTEPAESVRDLFRDYDKESQTIFGIGVGKAMKDYEKDVEDHAQKFYDAVSALSNISDTELAQNRSRYRNNFPGQREIEDLADIATDETPFYEVHRASLEAWSQTAIDAFIQFLGSANPCPDCTTDLSTIRRLADSIGAAFPVSTQNIIKVNHDELGLANVWVKVADDGDLTELLAAINRFRGGDPLRQGFLRTKRLETPMGQALAWADSVEKMVNGQITLRYKMEPSAGAEAASREFTFCDLSGFYKARRLSLNSPSFRDIEINPESETNNVSASFRLFNDTEGNDSESRIVIHGKELGLYGFVLADSSNREGDTFDRHLEIPLNYADRSVKGLFRFRFSESLALPPDWNQF